MTGSLALCRHRQTTKFLSVLLVLVVAGYASRASAQQQTTQQLPLPTGKTQTQSDDKRWQVTFDSNWSYFSTKTTMVQAVPEWAKSTLNYLPVAMQVVGIPTDELKVEFLVRSGYMDLQTASSTTAPKRFDGWTDTSVTSTVSYYGFNGFQPFASLALNLPSGDTGFVSATGDPDVTNIAGFGTGFNIGPTIGVNIPITRDLLTTLSAGYTQRGAFQRPGRNGPPFDIPGAGRLEDFKPGDVASVNASIGYQSGPWSFQASGSYSYEEITKIDSVGFYQTGGKYSLSGAVGYAWSENWSSKISSSFSHIGKNRYPIDPFTGLIFRQELFNTNSDMVNVTFDTTWKMGAFAIGPTASYLYRDHNGYDSNTDFFLPAKTKWTFGGAGQYAVTNQISFNARLEHLWMTENVIPGFPPPIGNPPLVPQLKTDGWIASFGGKVVF